MSAELAMALMIVAFSVGVICYLFKREDEESKSCKGMGHAWPAHQHPNKLLALSAAIIALGGVFWFVRE